MRRKQLLAVFRRPTPTPLSRCKPEALGCSPTRAPPSQPPPAPVPPPTGPVGMDILPSEILDSWNIVSKAWWISAKEGRSEGLHCQPRQMRPGQATVRPLQQARGGRGRQPSGTVWRPKQHSSPANIVFCDKLKQTITTVSYQRREDTDGARCWQERGLQAPETLTGGAAHDYAS